MEAPRKFYSSMLLRSNTLSVLERYSRRLNGNVDSIGYGVTLIDKLRYEEYHMTILHDPTFIQGHRKEMLTGTAGSQRTRTEIRRDYEYLNNPNQSNDYSRGG